MTKMIQINLFYQRRHMNGHLQTQIMLSRNAASDTVPEQDSSQSMCGFFSKNTAGVNKATYAPPLRLLSIAPLH